MSNPALCRVCLGSDIKMRHIANTRYQEIFEKLSTKLCTEDGRPQTVCYMCYSQLQRCCRFMEMARKAEEILTQFSSSGFVLSKDIIHNLHRKFVNFIQTPLQFVSVNTVEKTIVKKEEEDLTSNIKVESFNSDGENLERFKQLNKEERIEDVVKSRMVESINNMISEEVNLEAFELQIKEEMIENVDDYRMEESMISTCDNAAVKQEVDTESEISDVSMYVVKGMTEKSNFTEKTEVSDDKAVKKVKQEVDDSSLDAEADQEDAEDSYYEEISITNLQRERHACTYCSKSYTQKCHLNRHIKSHRAKTYTCEVCGMRFTQKCTFKKHYFRHTKERPFACNICPARCTQKIDLERHMMKHTGQKPFTCDICKLTFSRKCNMKLHILTHSDNKPFVCHICNSTFSRRYDLNRHNKRKHTGEKPFACNICDFRSVNASYVKTHIENKHWKQQGLKPFSCLECDFKCGNESYLKMHVQKKH